ncbi:MAG: hypothetical protein NTX65_15780 [Ignavibacteriales bacterium]|nr:hypothetical protein [Ignavibacteriales bacterium]
MKLTFTEKILSGKTIPKYFGIFGLLIIITFYISNLIDLRFIQDDAYTSFRYAKNFAEGKGLVFNEGEKVEGYTNFLWVMILSGEKYIDDNFSHNLDRFVRADQDQEQEHELACIEHTAQFLSIFFSIVVLILTFYLAQLFIIIDIGQKTLGENLFDEVISLIPVFILAFSTPLVYWGVSAMETTLFVSLTLFSIILYLKNPFRKNPNIWLVLVLVLNSLVRPEGLIVFILIITHKIFYNYYSSGERKFIFRMRSAIDRTLQKEIIFYTVAMLVFIVFRLIYYGYPLPNTFYAKTEFSTEFIIRGLNYFSEFAAAYLFYGFVLIFPLILFRNKKNLFEISFFYLIIICWTIINILIGGDVLPIHRFFLPIMPLVFILFVKAIPDAVNFILPRKKIFATIGSLIVLVLMAFAGLMNYNLQKPKMMEKRAYESGLVQKMKIYAEWVNKQNMSRSTSAKKIIVAMSTIGAFSYFPDVHVIDIVGLTDKYISHHPKEVEGIDEELPVIWKERHYNAEYVLSQKPDYIIFPAGAKPSAFAECALFVQDEFTKNYYTQIFYSDELHQLLPVFTRKENVGIGKLSMKCGIRYLKYYIEANNTFLRMIEQNDRSMLKKVLDECDRVIQICPQKISEINTLKGIAFYHANNFLIAQNYLLKAAESDVSNTIALYYLMKIYESRGETAKAANLIPKITLYSPDVFPNLVN